MICRSIGPPGLGSIQRRKIRRRARADTLERPPVLTRPIPRRRRMRAFPAASAVTALALVTALGGVYAAMAPTVAMAQTAGATTTTPSGLKIVDTAVGTGATPKPGQTCVMH